MGGLRVPPGRAGRIWLERRIRVALTAADLLDQKLRLLRSERRRLELLLERSGDAWLTAAREADTWTLRSAMLDGQRAVRLAQECSLAEVAIRWRQSMGVLYPDEAVVRASEPDPGSLPVGGAALDGARRACMTALEAAVRHAVVQAAKAVLDREEEATRRRLRAVENRWLPRLENALAKARFGIAEREHGDLVRLRWATMRRPSRTDRLHDA